MPQCYICGVEIPRGAKYKNPLYKNISVCSEGCCNKLVAKKESTPKGEPFPGYNKLFDYIKLQWGGNENVNWMLKRVEPYLKRKGFGANSGIEPNVVSYVYKSRFGQWADQKIKIWRYFDRARFRNIDLFCTNQYDEIVNIPRPKLEEEF